MSRLNHGTTYETIITNKDETTTEALLTFRANLWVLTNKLTDKIIGKDQSVADLRARFKFDKLVKLSVNVPEKEMVTA